MCKLLRIVPLAAAALLLGFGGCTSPGEYLRNGFKVGPNYCPPPAPAAKQWIDATDIRLRQGADDLANWWTVFQDPALNRLMRVAYSQNVSLREAGYRILEARAQLGIVRGEFFPQLQNATGSYRRSAASLNPPLDGPVGGANRFASHWNFGFNLAWELDFWGRFRRAITAAEAQLDASVFSYDDVLVTLLGDVAANYVLIRTGEERLEVLQKNLALEKEILRIVEERFRAQFRGTTELDVQQARANLAQIQATVPPLVQEIRLANNRLCILLGIPPQDLTLPPTPENACRVGSGGLETLKRIPTEAVVGIPADLLRRRPDVRRAERDAAAQAERIGIATADLYPAFTINGNLGWSARNLSHLFTEQAFNGSIGPSFQWNLLNYGRILNNVRFQEARFCELVATYQQTALLAGEEAENGIVNFLETQDREKLLDLGVTATLRARDAAFAQYNIGAAGADFNRYTVLEQTLIQQTDALARARGQIAQGLIQIYRALGGGWQIRLAPAPPANAPPVNVQPVNAPPPPPPLPEPIPAPGEAPLLDEGKPAAP